MRCAIFITQVLKERCLYEIEFNEDGERVSGGLCVLSKTHLSSLLQARLSEWIVPEESQYLKSRKQKLQGCRLVKTQLIDQTLSYNNLVPRKPPKVIIRHHLRESANRHKFKTTSSEQLKMKRPRLFYKGNRKGVTKLWTRVQLEVRKSLIARGIAG